MLRLRKQLSCAWLLVTRTSIFRFTPVQKQGEAVTFDLEHISVDTGFFLPLSDLEVLVLKRWPHSSKHIPGQWVSDQVVDNHYRSCSE